jgi:hypothetical protein
LSREIRIAASLRTSLERKERSYRATAWPQQLRVAGDGATIRRDRPSGVLRLVCDTARAPAKSGVRVTLCSFFRGGDIQSRWSKHNSGIPRASTARARDSPGLLVFSTIFVELNSIKPMAKVLLTGLEPGTRFRILAKIQQGPATVNVFA